MKRITLPTLLITLSDERLTIPFSIVQRIQLKLLSEKEALIEREQIKLFLLNEVGLLLVLGRPQKLGRTLRYQNGGWPALPASLTTRGFSQLFSPRPLPRNCPSQSWIPHFAS